MFKVITEIDKSTSKKVNRNSTEHDMLPVVKKLIHLVGLKVTKKVYNNTFK